MIFLKPFVKKIGGIPVRINAALQPVKHDVGLTYFSGNGTEGIKYFIVNASFGVTAEANWNFNYPGRVLRFLKKTSPGTAIMYTALQTILAHKNNAYDIDYNGCRYSAVISNINIIKNSYVSGTLHYGQQVRPDDGRLGLNMCMDMNRRELLTTLRGLEKGKFTRHPKKISVFTDRLTLHSERPVIFECDGETGFANTFTISVINKAINVMSG